MTELTIPGDLWFDPRWGRQLAADVQTNPLARRCAGALMRWQATDPVPTYTENLDSIAWLAYEATELAHIVTEYASADEVLALLASTGWWDPTIETDERPLAVAAELGVL